MFSFRLVQFNGLFIEREGLERRGVRERKFLRMLGKKKEKNVGLSVEIKSCCLV